MLKEALILNSEETAALVRATRAGDRQAFGDLYLGYRGRVLAVALRRLRDRDEAEELCQEVFCQALRKLDQLRSDACFGAWICSIARRMAVNRVTRRRPIVHAAPEVLEGAVCADESAPLECLLRVEQGNQIQAGLARLRRMDRETLVAFYVEGRSLAEMSEVFAVPLGTIKRRLHVARKRLAKEMAGQAMVNA